MKTEKREEYPLTFIRFIEAVVSVGADITKLEWELDCKGEVKAQFRIGGTIVYVAEKVTKLIDLLKPFLKDKFAGKSVHIEGYLDTDPLDEKPERKGWFFVDVLFRGLSIDFGDWEWILEARRKNLEAKKG